MSTNTTSWIQTLTLTPPSLKDNTADADRLVQALKSRLGNSSLGGATLALKTDKYHQEIDRIRDRITYLELNVNQDFMNRFSAAKFLPHTNKKLFPSVKTVQKR